MTIDGQGVFTLPPELAKKRQAIVNVNTTGECFKYALLSVLHYNDVEHQQRSNSDSYGEWVGELDFDNFESGQWTTLLMAHCSFRATVHKIPQT